MKNLFLFITLWSLLFAQNVQRTGEFLLDTNYVIGPAPLNQKVPQAAFDGLNYLVVWSDERSGDVYGARMTMSGELLDTFGIEVGKGAGVQSCPAVAFDGTNYLVVWADTRNGQSDIYGSRVSPAGVVLDPGGILISGAPSHQVNPKVAFGRNYYLVVWQDGRFSGSSNWNTDIYCARVGVSGNVLEPNGIRIAHAQQNQSLRVPAVAFDGENYLVVWAAENPYSLRGARVDTSGIVLDYGGFTIVEGSLTHWLWNPSVAFGDSVYLVTWEDIIYTSSIRGARVDRDANVLDPNGFPISPGSYPEVVFNGINFFVLWSSSPLYGALVNQAGTVINTVRITKSPAQPSLPCVAFGSSNYLVAWEDRRNRFTDIYGTPVSPEGVPTDSTGILISSSLYGQDFAATDFDGMNYLTVWEDYRGSSIDIYGVRINHLGGVLDPEGIPICCVDSDQISPDIAFDGTNYLVVWQDNRNGGLLWDIYGARVDQNGTVIDPQGFAITNEYTNEWCPSVVFDGTNYLVVYTDGGGTAGGGGEIYGIRVSQEGQVIDSAPGIPICYLPSSNQQSPVATFNGTNYLVVWEDDRYGYDFEYEIYGARVTPDGTVLDPNGIRISPFVSYFNHISPSVASDGNNYFVVWAYRDWNGGNPDYEIYGCRIDSSGNIIDTLGIPICTAGGDQLNPSVVYDGENYIIVWQDYRNGNYDIYGAKVNTSGVIIDSFVVSNQYGNQTKPVVTKGNGDTLLITYTGFVGEINGRRANTVRIWGKFYPFIGIEETFLRSTPSTLTLEVYPNPFVEKTEIKYTMQKKGLMINGKRSAISLKIYDATGRLVKSFSHLTNYQSSIVWDGTDDSGRRLPAGIYFVRLEINEFKKTEKVILLR
uniref:T9SS type A sorting domain-containing protein n=1 Tax=candidate division WOR-3 bacterium TaxID=2052148 RepID=A0A7V3VUF5_UNCW3